MGFEQHRRLIRDYRSNTVLVVTKRDDETTSQLESRAFMIRFHLGVAKSACERGDNDTALCSLSAAAAVFRGDSPWHLENGFGALHWHCWVSTV